MDVNLLNETHIAIFSFNIKSYGMEIKTKNNVCDGIQFNNSFESQNI